MQSDWQHFTENYTDYPSVGVSVDTSRIGMKQQDFKQLLPELERALAAMQELEKGSIANPDEDRMVGHYWLRDASLAPTAEITAAIRGEIEKVSSFAAEIVEHRRKTESGSTFSQVVLIGIGGSALGPQLLEAALDDARVSAEGERNDLRFHYLDNTDPAGFQRVFTTVGDRLSETLCLIVSKSGGTVETRNGMLAARRAFDEAGIQFRRHAVAITTEGSKLDELSKSEGWLNQFYLWDWIGGRTSIFSAVGLLPAALLGIDIDAFLQGAAEMDSLTRSDEVKTNPAAMLAAAWHHSTKGMGKSSMVVLPYCDSLSLFSKYLQQLVMESLGKKLDLDGNIVHEGIAVYGNKGSTDQHAYVQQLRDGAKDFFVNFIQVLKAPDAAEALLVRDEITAGDYLQGFLLGTREALSESDRPSLLISLDQLNPKTLGAVIALYERVVGLYATMVNINAYHQPGVEAGKKAAENVVALKEKVSEKLAMIEAEGGKRSAAELAADLDESPEMVFQILKFLSLRSEVESRSELDPESTEFPIRPAPTEG